MNFAITIVLLLLAAAGSFIFGTLAYSLRDYSRSSLGEWFEKRRRKAAEIGETHGDDSGKPEISPDSAARVELVVEVEDELALTAAVARVAANLALALFVLHVVDLLAPTLRSWVAFLITFGVAGVLISVFSVALPLAVASHAPESFIGRFSRLLRLKWLVLRPIVLLHRPIDGAVRRLTGRPRESAVHVEQDIEQNILELAAEGRDEGVINEAERQMIERSLRFQDTNAEQAMTPRSEIIGLSVDADATEVLRVIEETGYSRIPVYRETLDERVGVLYARDLFRFVGKSIEEADPAFDLAGLVRPPLTVHEGKALPDLLREMQLQKIHMALVLDEYGGTSGLVTIEDVLEELVGEIADEHEDDSEAMFKRIPGIDGGEADGRIEIEALNQLLPVRLPEDAGYETLAGFLTSTLEHIPATGATYERDLGEGRAASFRVLDAEPHRVNRVRIEVKQAKDEA
jgi:CBS domain containing-hemolysin-like protein